MTGIVFGNSAFAKTGEGLGSSKSLKATKEHRSIESHIRKIDADRTKIETLKGSVKKAKKADNEVAESTYRLNLKAVKADLKDEKADLKTEKKALLAKRKAEIKQKCAEKHDAKYALMEAKSTLKKDLRKDNTAALTADAARVALLTKQADKVVAQETALKADRDTYVMYINEEIHHSKGQSLAVTTSENTLARLDYLFLG